VANAFTALYIAYTIVWAGLFAYLLYLFMRQRSINRNIELLKQELSRHGK
jgi:CcmD family protein